LGRSFTYALFFPFFSCVFFNLAKVSVPLSDLYFSCHVRILSWILLYRVFFSLSPLWLSGLEVFLLFLRHAGIYRSGVLSPRIFLPSLSISSVAALPSFFCSAFLFFLPSRNIIAFAPRGLGFSFYPQIPLFFL